MYIVKNRLSVIFVTTIVISTLLMASCQPGGSAQAPTAVVPVTGATSAAPTMMASAMPTMMASAMPTMMASQMPTAMSTSAAMAPSVTVSDQPIQNGAVTVADVVSQGPGWIVIHVDDSGKPGAVIGHSAVQDGDNRNVVVTIDASKATPVLYAMLHTDAGVVGQYEFPGADKPVMVNGQMVTPSFHVTGGLGTPSPAGTATPSSSGNGGATTAPSGGTAAAGQVVVMVANNPKLGNILVDSKGMTLYVWKKDASGKSNCTGGCAENWPPLLVSSGSPTAGNGVTGTLGVIARTDNGNQVTYKNQPLYYFIGDKAPGDVNGQGVANAWFAAVP